MSKTKILIIGIIVIILFSVFIMPGFFPTRVFEPVFVWNCEVLLGGQVQKHTATDYQGISGLPVREDFIECGKGLAPDANRICYVARLESFFITGQTNPLGKPVADNCIECHEGARDIKQGNVLLGKECKPYRFLWRWDYKTGF